MSREAQIVSITAKVLGVELLDIIDDVENSGNAIGTDGYTHIMVSKQNELDAYPKTTQTLYAVAKAKLDAGTFEEDSDYNKAIAKNIRKLGKVPDIDIIHSTKLDEYNIIAWTDELMVHNLEALKKEEESKDE